MGPLNEVYTNRAINIGSATVIDGGITLNGGVANLLAISTTGDSVRLNGTVTLSTNVSIDTDSTNVGSEGGDIVFTAAAPVDSATGENNDLTADSGSANIVFNATV